MTKAIISPYEDMTLHGKTISVPSVYKDVGAEGFNSSDVPSTIIDIHDGERLIFMDTQHHSLAVSLGYVEVDI